MTATTFISMLSVWISSAALLLAGLTLRRANRARRASLAAARQQREFLARGCGACGRNHADNSLCPPAGPFPTRAAPPPAPPPGPAGYRARVGWVTRSAGSGAATLSAVPVTLPPGASMAVYQWPDAAPGLQLIIAASHGMPTRMFLLDAAAPQPMEVVEDAITTIERTGPKHRRPRVIPMLDGWQW